MTSAELRSQAADYRASADRCRDIDPDLAAWFESCAMTAEFQAKEQDSK